MFILSFVIFGVYVVFDLFMVKVSPYFLGFLTNLLPITQPHIPLPPFSGLQEHIVPYGTSSGSVGVGKLLVMGKVVVTSFPYKSINLKHLL